MKKLSLILIISLLHINAYTQKKFSLPFSTYYDENAIISFGIQYNYVYQNYQIGLKDNWQHDYPIDYPKDDIRFLGDLQHIQSKPGSGFSVGIPIDIRINQFLYLNTVPSFLFINNLGITYQSLDPSIEPLVRKMKHDMSARNGHNFKAIEIPLAIKLRSEEKVLNNKVNRYRAYIMTGVRYTKWIGLNNDEQAMMNNKIVISDPLVLKSSYFSWEAGIGLDIFFESFKVSPELKFNQSFTNVMDNHNKWSATNKFMAPIEKALIRNISFGLIFQ